jgi:hypothetical protein
MLLTLPFGLNWYEVVGFPFLLNSCVLTLLPSGSKRVSLVLTPFILFSTIVVPSAKPSCESSKILVVTVLPSLLTVLVSLIIGSTIPPLPTTSSVVFVTLPSLTCIIGPSECLYTHPD